jgi:histidine triad (HIT) family protein
MRDSQCIFCKILGGDIPSRTIYEDDDFQVIMDAEPATKGHVLILPKEHYANLYELPEEVAAKVLPLAKKLTGSMKEKLGCEGFNLVQNNGAVAGQTVNHFHMHLIPRYADGNKTDVTWNHSTFSAEELDEIRDLIRM